MYCNYYEMVNTIDNYIISHLSPFTLENVEFCLQYFDIHLTYS